MACVVEQRGARATGNIGAEANVHALVERSAQREHAVGEVGVGQRAMCDAGTTVADPPHVVGTDEVRMCQYAAASQQTEVVERGGVGLAKPVKHVAVLPVALRTMGLYVRAGGRGQLAEFLQHAVAAAWNEARGYRRQYQFTRQVAYVFDQLLRTGKTRVGGFVPVVAGIGGGVVHHHLAHHRALAVFGAQAGEFASCGDVYRSEVHRRGRAVAQQSADQCGVDGVCIVEIRTARFERKGALPEPVFQRQVQRIAELWPLRRVHMQIDEAGQKVFVVACGYAGRVRRICADACDAAVGYINASIAQQLEFAAPRRMHEAAVKRLHWAGLARLQRCIARRRIGLLSVRNARLHTAHQPVDP